MSLIGFFKSLLGKGELPQSSSPDSTICGATAACTDSVHIAYRGLADDRMYLVRDRKWAEVKYFKPNGLRVFCATCRRRLY